MLSPHIALRKLFYTTLPLFIILISCSDWSKTDLAVIEALSESIEESNKILAQSTEDILFSLKQKMSDPGTASIAKPIYPRVEKIQALSKEVFDFIEKIKVEIDKKPVSTVFEGIGSALYDSLIRYENKLRKVDSAMPCIFQESIIVFSSSFDSSGKSQDDLYRHFFKSASPVFAKAILIKFQNNIRINEERMIIFCHENMAIDVVIRDCNLSWPLIAQNSTIVRAGEQIEITAGLGSMTIESKPEVFVFGKKVPIKEQGVAIYRIKAASKPGKYYVPVKINYTDQDGKQNTVQKEIEYIVANIQKQ